MRPDHATRGLRIAAWGALLALTSGCVTTKPVHIESHPPGAKIFVNGTYVGVAPLSHPISDDETPGVVDNYKIEARLDGYAPAVAELRDRLGTAWIPDRLELKLMQRDGTATAPGGPAPRSGPAAAEAPVPVEGRSDAPTIAVPANADWVHSGLTVLAGGRYRLAATGRWKMAWGCAETDAAGTGLRTGLFCMSAGGEPVPGVNFQTLIGRIGAAGRPFVVGNGIDLSADATGILYLRSNSNALFDNVGVISVAVTELGDAPPAARAEVPAAPRRSPEPAPSGLPSASGLGVAFPAGLARPDDVAVIIGNANYTRLGKDIPNAVPAYADADGFRRFALTTLGIRDGNVIFLKDATSAQLTRVFGSDKSHKGQLYDWVKPGKSRVYVFYSGHGAPGTGDGGGAYLVPADADGARIGLNGFPLKTLYDNLAKLPAERVTVVLEACFSGASDAGSVVANASPVYLKARTPAIPPALTVVAAGAADQIASWERDRSHGLFTKYYLTGMAGAADAAPFGNGDGTVALSELNVYLKDTLTYVARRQYGRDQNAQIVVDGKALP